MPTPIENNTATIRTILEKVNGLPEGGGGIQSPGFKQVDTFEEWSSAASKANNEAFIILKEPSGHCFMMMNENSDTMMYSELTLEEPYTFKFLDALFESNGIDFYAHAPWFFSANCWYDYVNVTVNPLDGSIVYTLFDNEAEGDGSELGITVEYYVKIC